MSEREKDLVKLLVKKMKMKMKMKNVTITEACRGGGGGRRPPPPPPPPPPRSRAWVSLSLILGFSITVAILAEGGCLLSRFHTGALSLLFESCRLSEFTLAGPHSKASSSRTSAPSESHHYILQDSFFHGHSWPLTSRSQTDLSPCLHTVNIRSCTAHIKPWAYISS